MTGPRFARLGGGVLCCACAGSGAANLQCVPIEYARLTSSMPRNGGHFGWSVDLEGDLAIVGAHIEDTPFVGSGAAYLFDKNTQAELFRFVGDGSFVNPTSAFGRDVALTDGLALVGEPNHSPSTNGPRPGAAYLFDTATGNQLFKLLASDGGGNDYFGEAVDIDGADVVVGARGHDADPGDGLGDTGAAYIFDAATGTELHKLVPPVFAPGDQFGWSVAVSDGVAIVGNPSDDGAGPDAGKAFLFDTETGELLHVLFAADGAQGARFGAAVDIDGPYAIVGAWGDAETPGTAVGAAYLFDVETGQAIVKLYSYDPDFIDSFGWSVAIDDGLAVVGAYRDENSLATDVGAAYLYLASTGRPLGKVQASDPMNFLHFGRSVAVSGTDVLVGAERGLDMPGGINAGAAYLSETPDLTPGADFDGDGLWNSWEAWGIPYTDEFGGLGIYQLPDADCARKDLYFEIDAMMGFALDDAAMDMIVDAFADAPVDNPDGSTGITLHIERDDLSLLHVEYWQGPLVGCMPSYFDEYKAAWFGTATDRMFDADYDPDDPLFDRGRREARALAYRYGIVADQCDIDFLGCGRVGGDDFVVFFGGEPQSAEWRAGLTMHEMGHNLGLRHGGHDTINGKVNYPSIMNYPLTVPFSWNESFWRLDYSRAGNAAFNTIDESVINELNGVTSPGGPYADHVMPFGFTAMLDGKAVRQIGYAPLDGTLTDFGDHAGTGMLDGALGNLAVQDLNYVNNPDTPVNLPTSPSPGDVHEPHDDWANVVLATFASQDTEGVPGEPIDEPTREAFDWIDANFPPPPPTAGCNPADLAEPFGLHDLADVVVFVAAFTAMDPAADLEADGLFDLADVLVFVEAFGLGCP